jgi:hypothetical protein
MGKGLPGGRRQAASIDYRPEPNSSVAPDRDDHARRRGACMRVVCGRAAAAPAPAARGRSRRQSPPTSRTCCCCCLSRLASSTANAAPSPGAP